MPSKAPLESLESHFENHFLGWLISGESQAMTLESMWKWLLIPPVFQQETVSDEL